MEKKVLNPKIWDEIYTKWLWIEGEKTCKT